MNPINRIGQKVDCVVDEMTWLLNLCAQLSSCPQEHNTYTVTGFAEDYFGSPAIHLREIPGYNCSCKKVKNQPWDIRGFRPHRSSEEDISTFTKLLVGNKTGKKVDVE